MATVFCYIKRHNAQGGPDDEIETSDWRCSLMDWDHDSMKESA